MQIEYVNFIPGSTTPARVFHNTGVIQINRSRWNKIPQFAKDFILAHEEGHYLGKTRSELFADNYAFEKLKFKQPESLKNSIRALTEVLPMTTPEHSLRIREQIKRSLLADANKNEKAAKLLNELFPGEISSFDPSTVKPDYKNILIVVFILLVVILLTIFLSKK